MNHHKATPTRNYAPLPQSQDPASEANAPAGRADPRSEPSKGQLMVHALMGCSDCERHGNGDLLRYCNKCCRKITDLVCRMTWEELPRPPPLYPAVPKWVAALVADEYIHVSGAPLAPKMLASRLLSSLGTWMGDSTPAAKRLYLKHSVALLLHAIEELGQTE